MVCIVGHAHYRRGRRRGTCPHSASPRTRRDRYARSQHHNMVMMDNRCLEVNQNNHNSSIIITNLQNKDSVSYSLVLIKGIVTTFINNEEKIACRLKNNEQKTTYWNINRGEFKVLLELNQGENVITLKYGKESSYTLVLDYTPRNTNLRVTPVYIVCQGHDGGFQSPPGVDNSIHSACARIAIGSKLIQCITAEKLSESGFGRKTFQLEHEVNSKSPEVIIFQSSLNVNKARKMKQDELWTHFGRELMLSDLGSSERKFLAFISCTRYKGTDNNQMLTHEELVNFTEAYAALGGGGLALFGTACLYTWPSSVEEIIPKFLDSTRVNSYRFMDDSGYRGTLGGCFATTLGAVLHELGHTFDLGHTKDGIMGRGFDNIERVFTVAEKKVTSTKDHNLNNFNGKPVQHSTVALQRNINVTINVAEPLRVLGPRSKTTLGNFASMTKSDIVRRSPNITPITRPTSVYASTPNRFSEAKKNLQRSNGNDSIYWPRNCAMFLTYHRWFNNEYGRERQAITRYLKFDKNRMMILSTAGIRIVEVRDENNGMLMDFYEFSEQPEKRFILPFTFTPKIKILTVVVEDDLGNVLKQSFSY